MIAEFYSFPVILSSHLVRIFDEEIQSAFGFLAICEMVTSAVGEVGIGVCPIVFANYLKERCLLRTEGGFDAQSLSDIVREMDAHRCTLNKNRYVLWFALKPSIFTRLRLNGRRKQFLKV